MTAMAPIGKVRILKGALVKSTAPDWPLAGRPLKRMTQVQIAFIDAGYMKPGYRGEPDIQVPATVRWAGSGGYWRWTDATNIEAEAPSMRIIADVMRLGGNSKPP